MKPGETAEVWGTNAVQNNQNDFWTDQKIRVEVRGPRSRFSVELEKPFALIGTHPRADVFLPGTDILRRQGYFHVVDNSVFYVDFDRCDANGFWGDWLDDQEVLCVGDYELKVQLVSGMPIQRGNDSLLEVDREPISFPKIHCAAESASLGVYQLKRRLSVIGRSEGCTFQFSSRTVSPQHCIIYRDKVKTWVVGLRSNKRTLLKNKAIRCARVKSDMEFSIGRVTMRFEVPKKSQLSDVPVGKSSFLLSRPVSDSADVDKLKIQIENLRFENESLNRSLTEDRDKVSRLESRMVDLNIELVRAKNSSEKAESELSLKQEEFQSLKDQVARQEDAESTLQQSRIQLEALEMERDELAGQLKAQTVESQNFQNTINDLREQLTQLESARLVAQSESEQECTIRNDLAHQIEVLQQDVTDKATSLAALTEENQQAANQLSAAAELVTKLQEENDSLSQSKEQLTVSKDELETQLSEAQEEYKDSQIRSQEVEIEVSSLVQMIRDLGVVEADEVAYDSNNQLLSLRRLLIELCKHCQNQVEEASEHEEETAVDYEDESLPDIEQLRELEAHLAIEREEINAEVEKLEAERKAFERFVKNDVAQRELITRLRTHRRDKTVVGKLINKVFGKETE